MVRPQQVGWGLALLLLTAVAQAAPVAERPIDAVVAAESAAGEPGKTPAETETASGTSSDQDSLASLLTPQIPVSDIVGDVSDGVANLQESVQALSAAAIKNAMEVQESVNEFVKESVRKSTLNIEDVNEVSRTSIQEALETARETENVIQNTLKSVGEMTRETTRVIIDRVAEIAKNLPRGQGSLGSLGSLGDDGVLGNSDIIGNIPTLDSESISEARDTIRQITDTVIDSSVNFSRTVGEALRNIADGTLAAVAENADDGSSSATTADKPAEEAAEVAVETPVEDTPVIE